MSIPSMISLRMTQLCVGFVPFLIIPGIEEYLLLPRLFLLQLASFVIAITWTLFRFTIPFFRCPLYLPAIAFFLILSASPLWAINPFRSTYDLSKHITYFLFFILLMNTLNRHQIPAILRISAISGGLISILGIGEYLGLIPDWIPSTGRPSSTFGFRNLAASYLVASLPLSGLLFLICRSIRDRLLGGLSVALMFVFLLYTRGRGSWIGLFGSVILSVGVWIAVDRRGLWTSIRESIDRPALIVGGGALLVVCILGPISENFRETHLQRFDEKKSGITSAINSIITKGGDRGRWGMWERTLAMVLDAPILGVGLGNWEYVYPLYDKALGITDDGMQVISYAIGPNQSPHRPHNDLLWIWSEEGSLGLFFYLSLLTTFLFLVIRIWKRISNTQERLTALGCSISIFSIVGTGCFGFPWERVPPSLLFWLVLSIIGILTKETEDSLPGIYRSYRQAHGVVLLIPIVLLATMGITLKYIGFDYYYIKTMKAFLKKDHSEVLQHSKNAIAFGPFDHQIFIMRGDGHLKTKNYDLARKNFQNCLTYHPNFANAFSNIGLTYLHTDQVEKSLNFFRKVIELVPAHHIALHNIGIAFHQMNQLDSAIVYYKKAFVWNFSKPYVNLGSIYRQLGLVDSAIVVYKEAATVGTPSIEAYFNLGNIYNNQRQYKKAIEAYTSFLSLWQGDSNYIKEASQGIGHGYSGLAIQAEERAVANPARLDSIQLNLAIEANKTAIQYWPSSAQIWFNLGNNYWLKKTWDEAAQAYLESLARDTSFVSAYNQLGMTLGNLGSNQKAIAVYQKALQIQPNEPILHYNMGNTYLTVGDTSSAINSYNRFLDHWTGQSSYASIIRNKVRELTH